jgi:hypothetical protein
MLLVRPSDLLEALAIFVKDVLGGGANWLLFSHVCLPPQPQPMNGYQHDPVVKRLWCWLWRM